MTEKCKCSHARLEHGRGVGQCYATVCGCGSYRPKEPAIPARLDERYDPSPDPIDRKTR